MSYGRLMLDLAGTELSQQESVLLQNPQVGGVILFARNIESPEQVADLLAQVRAANPDLLLAVDQEGGRVQRLQQGFTRLPAMQLLGDQLLRDPVAGLALAEDVGWLLASEVLACGFDISFAPVLDVDRETSSIIGDRAFSDQPELVVDLARAFIAGMHEAGMAVTGKHFPGHGGVVADSHLEAPVDNRSWQELQEHDLKPFAALAAELDGVMPAHITFPCVDPDSVGFSAFWLQQVLRQQLGFDGVIFSDDLSMKGADIAGGYCEKAELALDAGCDMILVCNCPEGAVEVVDFMQSNNISGSDRIAAMRARKSVSWEILAVDNRRLETIAKLQLLMGTGQGNGKI
ncbi:beta-N-acetylhexosaminidase [SAR92 clade bacterium H246]